jgi:hypothetical protein
MGSRDNNTKMANTLSNLRNAQKDLINDFMRELIDESVFLGELPPIIFQGTNFGYTSGGFILPGTTSNIIDKFPFASDANATDVGDLLSAVQRPAGQSSTTHGYTSGGVSGPSFTTTQSNTIQKFPFTSDGNATDVGDLTVRRTAVAGQASAANGYGYSSGGGAGPPNVKYNVIDKFPFSADANAADVGNLTIAREFGAGQSSDASGYTSGGYIRPTDANQIDKFSFATDTNATDVGDLTIARWTSSGQSSKTHGYTSGGWPPATSQAQRRIDKFSFASDGNATDVGDLSADRRGTAGQSSTLSGYSSGRDGGTPPVTTVIEKFPFSTDANTTDVGDLTVGRGFSAGQQY